MVLVLGGHDPPDGLALIPGLADEPPRLLLVPLVVERGPGLGMPGLLDEEEARVEPEEVPVPHGGEHRGLHVDRRLDGLADALVLHDPLLEIEDQGRPAVRLGDHGLHAGHAPEPVVLVRLDLLDEVVLAGLHPGLARRVVGHRQEQDLVDVRHALAPEPVRGLRPGAVAVEADEPDVPVGAMLGELEGPGPDVLLELALAGGLHDLLRVDRREARDRGQDRREDRRRLRQADLHRVRPLRLRRFDRLEHRLPGPGDLAPALERGDHVVGRELLAVVEPHALPEPDDVALGAVERVVALGEEGDRLELRVERVERLEHVDADLAGDRRGRRVRVERRRLADHPDPERAALLGGLGARIREGDRGRDGQQDQEQSVPERGSSHHRGSLPPGARAAPQAVRPGPGTVSAGWRRHSGAPPPWPPSMAGL